METGYYGDESADEQQNAQPNPEFLLAPLNAAARKVVNHENNQSLRTLVNDTIGLWCSFSSQGKPVYTLGSDEDADIYLPDTKSSSKGSPHISGVHASFNLVEKTGAILLFDESDNHTVEPLSSSNSYTVKFRHSKSVLVAQGINPRIALGQDQWYQFEIQWHSEGLYDFPKDEPYRMGPRSSRTKKYLFGGDIGAGSYGAVSWAMDATNGRIVAVKKFHKLSGKNLEFATREIANLFRITKDDSIKHEHILQILDYFGGGKGDGWGEIMMPLMKGNLKALIDKHTPREDHRGISDLVLRQMLLALECIAHHKIIHRDVKPENILWDLDESTGTYRFCLGDFGLSNDPELARTAAGTEPFMAPEVFGRKRQTTKVDIWSLFATIVWTRTPTFRQRCSQMGALNLHAWLVEFAKTEDYANIKRMASMEPKKRPSATEQLAILDGQFDDEASVDSYGSASGDELGDDLNAHFSNVLNLQDGTPGLMFGSGSSGAVTSPEMPYYEPYLSGVLQESYMSTRGGPSKGHYGDVADGADAPRGYHQHYVNPYTNPYGPAVARNSGSGTEVPDNWTAVAPTTVEAVDEPTVEEFPRRKHKGKHRA
ncbi:kinase-like domain-containing protein [Chaetomium sp. MPI-SDFR-AT-0129]|nr:kinase-like domain-containing protein [Chaetomium sp. MPI-SDFR-AT-0129]